MIVYGATRADLERAAEAVSPNLEVRCSREWDTSKGPRVRFTLWVRDSRGRFARLTVPWDGKQHRMPHACWHAHGLFFEQLFLLRPEARFKTALNTITREHGNWTDRNIGSAYRPCWYSEACECGPRPWWPEGSRGGKRRGV